MASRQRAVDAILYSDFGIPRFDVNIARPPLERGEDDGIDEPDDRARLFLRDLFDRDRLFAAFILTNQIELETFGRLVQHALRRFRLLQQVLNFRKRRDLDDQIGRPSRADTSSMTTRSLGSAIATTSASPSIRNGTKL